MTTTTEASTKAERMTTNLRAIADWIEAHPDVPPTHIQWQYGRPEVQWLLFGGSDDNAQIDEARRIRRAIGGIWDKSDLSDLFKLTRSLPDGGVACEIVVSRTAACVRKVVGVEEVTIPAVEAQPERVEQREIVEWECGPILADEPAAVAW